MGLKYLCLRFLFLRLNAICKVVNEFQEQNNSQYGNCVRVDGLPVISGGDGERCPRPCR